MKAAQFNMYTRELTNREWELVADPQSMAKYHFDNFGFNNNPYIKDTGVWNKYENAFLNAKLKEENRQ